MKVMLGLKYIVMAFLAFVAALQAQPGDILSYFSPGETQVWGLEMKETETLEGGGTSQLHVMVAGAQVMRFDVTTASGVKNGSLSAYDSKTQMMRSNVSAFPLLGLAIVPSYEGPYGIRYTGSFNMGDGRITQCVWGEQTYYGDPGNLEWAVINGQPNAGVNGYWNEGDLCGAQRAYEVAGQKCWTTWSSASDFAPTPYGIYLYQIDPWGLRDSYIKMFPMPKAVYGVTLGAGGDLYVLCQDREILHISDSTGAILDRFYLDAAIVHPFGITYDLSEGSLWISDFNTFNIYQIDVTSDPIVAGSVLSSFSTGETQVWGLEMKETDGYEQGGTSQLHAMVAGAQVMRFDVTTASTVKDGSLSAYDNKTQMMRSNVSAFPLLGLAIVPSYEGPYGIRYEGNFSMGDGRTTQSVWGEPTYYGNPGNLEWGVINGQPNAGVNGYWNEGDLCAAQRTYEVAGQKCWTTWSSASELSPTPYGIYRYQMDPWGLRDSYDRIFAMPKALYGVSLGSGGDLYVLCQDREILHISDSTGAILDRFYLDDSIAHPFGITFDVSEGTLWISDFGTQKIFQVAVAAPVTEPEGAGRVLSSFAADVTEVWGLDIFEESGLGNEGSFMACDIYKDFYVNDNDFATLVSGWLSTTDTAAADFVLPGQTMLHLVGALGQINRYDVKTASKVKDGSVSAYDSKFTMTSPSVQLNTRGLTVLHDYAGAYGRTYVTTASGGSVWRSIWGVYGEPNSLTFAMINGGVDDGAQYEPDNWSEQKNNGDICVDRRTWSEANTNLYLWHTYSNSNADYPYVGAGAENTIYKYLYTTWLVSSEAYELKIDMDKPLRGISIGDNSDLWVLCQDGEVLNIANTPDANGGPTIINRFYLSPQVSAPWGIAYDPSEKTLWVSDQADKIVYQISTGVDSPEEFLQGDFNKDRIINIADLAILASEWLVCTSASDQACDPGQGIVFP